MSVSPARLRAAEALRAVARGAPFDAALHRALDALSDPRERAFCAELVQGAVRWRGRYDHVIDHFAQRPDHVAKDVRDLLRLALHQLLACDGVPDYAAVDQTVQLARQGRGAGAAGFVNGLLQNVRRRLGEDQAARRASLPRGFATLSRDPVAHLSTWASLPPWLAARWVERFGAERAAAVAAAANTPPPLWLHVLPGADPQAVATALAAEGADVVPGPHPSSLRLTARLGRDALGALLAAHPELIVQDLHVQEATELLAADLEGPGLDLCAAPGGKTLHLRRRLPDDALLVAADLGAARLAPLRANLERVEPGPVSVVSADGMRAPFRDGAFGAVLLDGPCSGTGVLRHHPEGRWRLEPGTPARNGALLADLAAAAVRLLRPGGRLLYATCSLEREENEDVLEALRRTAPELEPDPWSDGAWQRRWWPDPDGGDGFFAARLRRGDPAGREERTT
ncbi:MAG TPA: transcription antitermination factor NusB [Candidatus Krumholzibacteria bacterium]|nr:transcription antitermination factor NusB [Candidatus Krumholzibacteria bacterium]HRX50297.1 transcription antitermination factor NusB [Candidatus Krumholzibacteria bacterium]